MSLLDMLEFNAHEFVEVTHRMGIILGKYKKSVDDPKQGAVLGEELSGLLASCDRLGLKVTARQLSEFLVEIVRYCPESAKLEGGTLHIVNAKPVLGMTIRNLESICSTLKAELASHVFLAIPQEKALYADPKWLTDTPVFTEFPNAWRELQSGGRCYAYGENNAAAYHLNRALEWGLKSLAVHLGKRFDRNTWERHLEDIDKALESRCDDAKARSEEEMLYSRTATHFGNLKIAWRNPTMHIEADYNDRDGAYLVSTVSEFIHFLAKNKLREPRQNNDREEETRDDRRGTGSGQLQ